LLAQEILICPPWPWGVALPRNRLLRHNLRCSFRSGDSSAIPAHWYRYPVLLASRILNRRRTEMRPRLNCSGCSPLCFSLVAYVRTHSRLNAQESASMNSVRRITRWSRPMCRKRWTRFALKPKRSTLRHSEVVSKRPELLHWRRVTRDASQGNHHRKGSECKTQWSPFLK